MKFEYNNVIEYMSNRIKMLEIDNAIMNAQLQEVEKERKKQEQTNGVD